MPFSVTIQRLIPGGRGYGLYEGRPVFVPLSAPGDHILVRSVKDRKSYIEALEFEVLQPSPVRKLPPCPHFGICGGCDLQQIEEGTQLSAKREILVDALQRIGKIQFLASEIKSTPSPFWHYRNRIQLKVKWDGDQLVWGFYRTGTHEIALLNDCLITLTPLWLFSERLMKWLNARYLLMNGHTSVEILQGDNEEFLVEFQLESQQASDEDLAGIIREFDRAWFRQASTYVSQRFGRSILVTGRGFVSKTVGDLVYQVGQGSFFQVNELMLSTLRNCASVEATGRTALDLFSGVGFFSLALARRFDQVLAVELSPSSGRDLRRNLVLNRFSNCQLFTQEATVFLREHRNRLRALDLVLLNPPRAGLPMDTVAEVACLRAPLVVYVSCDPTTLSRDLGVFLKHQYEVSSLEILDLFPQTHHFETVAKLRRVCA
ncbi:MAG TPA: 23S rRNA (uracil(1939)-C(5))-methyltransferase RlmD [Terriglobia bacterium]|nr:23S rRNA (uracil(1939)-C(5))-methyltransferase RlmD [Terriglobia bacterium]